MPRKIVQRFLPDPHRLKESRFLQFFGPLIEDPYLFHINRKSISLSFFIGLFCAYLPIPGQFLVAASLALWWRSNLPLALSLIWITNPVTIAPMFLLSYSLGNLLLGREGQLNGIELSWEWMSSLGSELLPLVLGSLVCGLILGLTGYFLIRYLWRLKVIDNWEKRAAKRLAKKQNIDV